VTVSGDGPRQLVKKLGVALAVVAAALLLAAVFVAVSSLPRRSGTRSVPGLRAAVRIETDSHGVPAIHAASADDAFFGLGWAHARDRLWQMELQRRIGSGRLAEALGSKLVATDRFLRTVGFRRAARAELASLSPRARTTLSSYRAGVNAFLARGSGLPVEFRILRISPAPFDDVDCLVWAKLMAWDLGGNASAEIRRARIESLLGPERAGELFPAAPPAPTILRDGEWRMPSDPPASPSPAPARAAAPGSAGWERLGESFALLEDLGFGGETLGSNSWVLSGSRTRSGRPILANDPHLGLRTPSIWYLARLEAPGFLVEGATLPGLPGVVIGRNARIAWGLTNLEPDVQDLFVEVPDPAHRDRYLSRGRSLAFERRVETIHVRGGADVRFEVRTTVHGPVVTDVLAGADRFGGPVALRWTGLDDGDRTAEAFLAIDRAADWPSFLAGVELLHCPAQNFVYADADGHIGYTASGAMPIRPRSDGMRPVPGDGGDDWTGVVPFANLPRALDPERGYVVTANNRVVSEKYPYPFSRDWPEPYRARRIEDRILALPRLSVDDVRAISLDQVSYQARDLLPLLLDTKPSDDASRRALDRLRGWNFEFSPESVPATIYAAWYAALSSMPEDELKEPAAPSVRSRFVIDALRSDSPWCDDVRTARRETCAEFKASTLAGAVAGLRRRLGDDAAGWRWERLHRARFPHNAFDGVPVLSKLFSLEIGQGGDASTVNVGAYRRDGTFRMSDGPTYRQIVDFADLPGSRYVHTTGQSGNPFEKSYRNFLPMWREGRDFVIGEGPMKVEVLEPEK
jgi:penicillin G amidase